VIGLLLWLGGAVAAPAADLSTVHGMTISCPTWGWEWGTDDMASTLTVLDGLGVNWVSVHPYARVDKSGHLQWEPIDPANPPVWLTRPIADAHARGQGVLIKPHLAYWGSGWSWRGEIHFEDEAARQVFFTDYQRWTTELAAATAGADAFSVGTELDQTVGHEDQWRAVIRSVRAVFPGSLTYAANWDRFDEVPFWDALDAVGVQAYFPIAPDVPADALTPEVLDAGWQPWLAKLRAVHARTGKPVVFTEFGYDRSDRAATAPWERGGGPHAAAVQKACLQAAWRAIDSEPAVVGGFLWKWFPGEVQRGDFRMSDPHVRGWIQDAWGRADSARPMLGSAVGDP
jgi:hypothetical protein